MGSNLVNPDDPAIPRHHLLSRGRLALSAALLALFVLCVVFSWVTRDAMAHLPLAARQHRGVPGESRNTIVDLRPWQTAQALAPLAVTAEETEYAREAERLADHEVDQAFASALRRASAQRHALTGEALKVSQKVKQLQQLVREDQTRVKALTKTMGLSASREGKSAPFVVTADDLDLAQAQLGLDSDELTDAQNDLARALGDERNTIQQELVAHEASMRNYDANIGKQNQVAVLSAQRYGTLARRLKAWMDQRNRNQLIQQAMHEAKADVNALTTQHNQLEAEANPASSVSARTLLQSEGNNASGLAPDKTAQVASLKKRATQHQLLSIYDDRIQTQQQLAAVYGKWSTQVLLQHRTILHLLLRSFALIALILLCVVLFDTVVRHLVERPTLDRRRMHTLRILLRLGVRVVGLLFILIVIFGAPSEMPTIIGFTTAGMTVVLQDFILAFLGWFVLMGKNGIRVGDWVEIDGIGGEVIETGLIRTVMLETGNWTDKGHPTGRRVTLMNSFAVKGQYFNFSTTGQWMWDEITVTIPPTEDAYRIIELIHKTVLKETENDARVAAQEWKRLTKRNGLGRFAAASSVDMRPGLYGIDLVVRYVTRASERFEVRNRLYQCVIDLLHRSTTPRDSLGQLQPSAHPE
jgi:small-conductance mechanosensitive channel